MSKFKQLFILFLLSGCANYVNNMHKEFDNYENKNTRSIQSNGAIEELAKGDKRYVANDFKDKSEPSSLWVGNGEEKLLFIWWRQKEKRRFDNKCISKIENQISNEISRFYPDKNNAENTPP